MRFLVDHDVYAVTARYLSELGHDFVVVEPGRHRFRKVPSKI
jgi:hypothetical protein